MSSRRSTYIGKKHVSSKHGGGDGPAAASNTTTERKVRRESSTDRTTPKVIDTKAKILEKKTTTKTVLSSTRTSTIPATNRPVLKPALNSDSSSSLKSVVKPKVAASSRLSDPKTKTKRVEKTQYFPNTRQLYKNALESERGIIDKAKPSKPAAKIPAKPKVISKPTKSKLESENSSDSASISSDRPGTATLKKGLIVNTNIVGPDAPKLMSPHIDITSPESQRSIKIKAPLTPTLEDKPSISKKLPTPEQQSDEDYDDDFESYASDFEEYIASEKSVTRTLSESSSAEDALDTHDGAITSSSSSSDDEVIPDSTGKRSASDEERKLDSGNFDLPENKHRQKLDDIDENDPEVVVAKKPSSATMASLSDEGFEDSKPAASVSPTLNFKTFTLKLTEPEQQRQKTRGEELMEMIRLDTQSYLLFDMPAVSYDDFILRFGNEKSAQVHTQTAEDAYSEEVQTDCIEVSNKWTQFPPKLSKTQRLDDNYVTYRSELVGVGSDDIKTELEHNPHSSSYLYSEVRLASFLTQCELLFAKLLKDQNATSRNMEVNATELCFSEGFITLNTNYKDLLLKRVITNLMFAAQSNSKMLSVHKMPEEAFSTPPKDAELRCYVCVWDIDDVSRPEAVLSSFAAVTSCCFYMDDIDLVLGGLADGTVNLWNVNKFMSKSEIVLDEDFSLILPVFTTQLDFEVSSAVIYVDSMKKDEGKLSFFNTRSTIEIVTINEDSILRTWGLIEDFSKNQSTTSRSLSLVENHRVLLSKMYPELEDFQCLTAIRSCMDPNHIFISTNHGQVLHVLASRSKANPRKYVKDLDCSTITSLSASSHEPSHFLTGTSNGAINMYSRSFKRPLMSFNTATDGLYGRNVVRWSKTHPCLFYALDTDTADLQCWDLTRSDLTPSGVVRLPVPAIDFTLSPVVDRNHVRASKSNRTYMAICTKDNIYVHVLSEDHGQQPLDHYQNELTRFISYVTRL